MGSLKKILTEEYQPTWDDKLLQRFVEDSKIFGDIQFNKHTITDSQYGDISYILNENDDDLLLQLDSPSMRDELYVILHRLSATDNTYGSKYDITRKGYNQISVGLMIEYNDNE